MKSELTLKDLENVLSDISSYKPPRRPKVEMFCDIPNFKQLCRMFGGFYLILESNEILIRTSLDTGLPDFIDRYTRMFPKKPTPPKKKKVKTLKGTKQKYRNPYAK